MSNSNFVSYYYEGELVPKANLEAMFHGESWYRCPHCERAFEYYDAHFERDGIKKLSDFVYICPECGKKFSII
jgi:DNA-directed RNA polymerase subunit RPC12/RpoP